MIRIHVNTASLQVREPAIIIVDPYGKYTQQYARVDLCCPQCQTKVATLDQQGDSAHLVLDDVAALSVQDQ